MINVENRTIFCALALLLASMTGHATDTINNVLNSGTIASLWS